MNVKIVVSSLYLMLAYFISMKFANLHMLFFPTLGAFSFLLSSRKLTFKEMTGMLVGASAASAIGVGLYMLNDGPVTIFIAALLAMKMIVTFKLNAPPIIAVCLIPFFSHPATAWVSPVFTFVSLGGLFAAMWVSDRIVQGIQEHPITAPLWIRYRLYQDRRGKSVSS